MREEPISTEQPSKEFRRPSGEVMSLDDVVQAIATFIGTDTDREYKLIVGTDSLLNSTTTTFVTAIIIHRVGKGGRYYYRRTTERRIDSLRQRMMHEASLSLEVASRLTTFLSSQPIATDTPIEIHLDVGPYGETKRTIREVVGMVVGSGYMAITKPLAFGAMSVADKHSR